MTEKSPHTEPFVTLSATELDLGAGSREANVDLLANVVSCVMDEALLDRVGSFMWKDSRPLAPLTYARAVPVNRWERACLHFWDTLFSSPVDVGPEDARSLRLLLEDLMKAASRCRAGDVCLLMDRSAWAQALRLISSPPSAR